MSNFLQFIDEDIEAKKTLFSTMPTKTKTDIKKFNEKIALITAKYNEYKASVKKYVDTKSKSFNIKNNNKNVDELNNNVSILEHVRFILNPTNTFLEKMGFDNLLYKINNYYDFNFTSLNDIINEFLDKFESAGINLTNDDFNYTCYVNQYMISFLEARNSKNGNYDKVSEMFESIYWVNPEIIEHIELNFRRLMKKHEKDFNDYIEKLQKDIMLENSIDDYDDCLEKLKAAYDQLNAEGRENICDIINLAKNGQIDINNYFEDSRVRTSTYTSLMIDSQSISDKTAMEKFYDNLGKLKINIEEYSNYLKFMPLIDAFKEEYKNQTSTSEKDGKSNDNHSLKNIESQIADKEAKLEKTNKEILNGGKVWFFESKSNDNLKRLKINSIKQAKELHDLYKVYDQEYFKDKVLSILNSSLTISELLNLYYSFDYFKKIAIKNAFKVTTYDEIIKYSDSFDLFAMNPTNIIINGIELFEDNNIARVIVNRYRLENINLTDENLNSEELDAMINKIQLLLRINEIESSPTTVEKIWFMVEVEKFNKAESKKD